MEVIKCTQCGSTDVVLQGDIWQCQHCQAKFKKKPDRVVTNIVNKEVKILPKVPMPSQIGNLFTLAEEAFKAGDSYSAKQYIDQALMIDDENWRLWQAKGRYSVKNSEKITYHNKALKVAGDDEREEAEDAVAEDLLADALNCLKVKTGKYDHIVGMHTAGVELAEALPQGCLQREPARERLLELANTYKETIGEMLGDSRSPSLSGRPYASSLFLFYSPRDYRDLCTRLVAGLPDNLAAGYIATMEMRIEAFETAKRDEDRGCRNRLIALLSIPVIIILLAIIDIYTGWDSIPFIVPLLGCMFFIFCSLVSQIFK